MSIYQEIWDADQASNGVRPILKGAPLTGAGDQGFIVVEPATNAGEDAAQHKVLSELVLPEHKKTASYDRVLTLFDNYALDEQDEENETPEEREEIHDFLSAIIETPPMQVARDYVSRSAGTTISRERWYSTILEMWFRRFSLGGDPALSGFEHVFVGEQQGSKAQGYHFWYKYYLDDGLAAQIDRNRFPGFKDDRIVYVRGKFGDQQERFPESVTIAYRWDAPDYDRKATRPLTKPTGGFFVGCSAEGLMALGAVRAHVAARAPKEAVINGARYELAVFRSDDNQHIRTFYPKYLGPAADGPDAPGPMPGIPAPPAASNAPVRILSALINPIGDDPGREVVTIINAGVDALSLDAWRLVDKMGNCFDLSDVKLSPGVAHTIRLPKNSIQLSNKGGEIRMIDRDGRTVHFVSYSHAQAMEEGRTLIF